MERLKPDATGIYVAAHQAPGAIEEAIEAEVPLIVAVAEHIPIHDILRVLSSPRFGSCNTDGSRYIQFSKHSQNLDLWGRMLLGLYLRSGSVELAFNRSRVLCPAVLVSLPSLAL